MSKLLVDRFVAALAVEGRRSFDPAGVQSIADLKDGEAVEWIAQTYIERRGMVNLFGLIEPGVRDAFVAVITGDDGRYLGLIGPARSEAGIKRRVGRAPSGWTAMN